MKEFRLTGSALAGLYRNAGEAPGLERILKRFYARMRQDVLIGFFFDGKDTDLIALRQKEFLMRAWGASPSYNGKSPADAHANLPPILRGHFDRRLVVLRETLAEFGLDEESIATWLGFEEKFRPAIEREEAPVSGS